VFRYEPRCSHKVTTHAGTTGSFSAPRFSFWLTPDVFSRLKSPERDDLRKLRESDRNPFEESVPHTVHDDEIVMACLECERLGAEHARRQRVQAAALQLLNDEAGVTPANEYMKLRAANDGARLDFNLARMELENHFQGSLGGPLASDPGVPGQEGGRRQDADPVFSARSMVKSTQGGQPL